MRLDKYLSNLWFWSRKDITRHIKNWVISVNWETISQKDLKINIWDQIQIWDNFFEYKENIYVILNKPHGYISSRKPEWWHKTYLELLDNCVYGNIINIVWRLDFDTTGLLLLTNDWNITHNIIHPKKDIFKKYKVKINSPLSESDIKKLETWVKIDEYLTKPAKVEIIYDKNIYLSISEWKFHQVKKMLAAVKNEVIKLHREKIWNLDLWNLEIWDWKYLTKEEFEQVFEK